MQTHSFSIASVGKLWLTFFYLSLFAFDADSEALMPQLGQLAHDFPTVTNVAQLRHVVNGNMGAICAFLLEGTVLAVNPDSGKIFFQDDSGVEILETSLERLSVQPGQRIRLEGTNYVTTTAIGMSLGKQPVVDNDGWHVESECTATLQLKAGRYPIQVRWFNNRARGFLSLAYSSPAFSRQAIPDSALSRLEKTSDGKWHFTGGLNFRCFEGEWTKLPNFQKMTPVKTGVASNFDLSVETRAEFVGLSYDGFIDIEKDGPYTFYLRSDDGSQLFIYNAELLLTVVGDATVPDPKRIAIRQPIPNDSGSFWAEVEGRVTFFGKQQKGIEMELSADDTQMRLLLCDGAGGAPAYLLGSRVRVRGVCLDVANAEGRLRADTLVIPDWKSVQVLEVSEKARLMGQSQNIQGLSGASGNDTKALPLLTTAAQVQQLKHEEARREYHAKIRGVVIWVSENRDCVVIQDATRGVFVGLRSAWKWESPKVGEILEVEGTCVPSEFSPIVVLNQGKRLGMGRLPAPVRPTWDQLIGGSMDSQYVEIRGLVTAVHENQMTLLMPGGKIEVEFAPKPAESLESFVNSVVRIRGCLFAKWDTSTFQVTIDHPLWFGSSIICVDTPPPADPFDADKMRGKELLQYDVQRNYFRRVKVSGQILCGRGQNYSLTDEGSGLRLQLAKTTMFNPGDLVEAAGLVHLGEDSPVLQEAVARKTGQASMPEPQELFLDQTNINYDLTRVWIDGVLLNSRDSLVEHILEIQAGLKRFIARLPAKDSHKINWPVGSRLKLTGIYSGLSGDSLGRKDVKAFELLVNSPADIKLLALPPWWTLNRLLTVMALLAAGLALAFIWIRLLQRQVARRTIQLQREIGERERAEQERAIEQERSRIARDLHDDLGSSLTAVNMLAISSPKKQLPPEATNERLQLIAEKTRLMVTTLDELVWAVNPKNDTLVALAEYIASYAEEVLKKTDIVCRVELPLEFPNQTIASEVRHNILLSVREALNNAIRHGRPGEVFLQLTVAKDELKILIQDNGAGFNPANPAQYVPGNGLVNLNERMSKVNGHCQIRSTPGNGTEVCLSLPL